MLSILSSLFATLFFTNRKPRIYIDAAHFDPNSVHRNGRAVLLVTCNEEATIFERVRQELRWSSGVVVLDRGSIDGTPYFAAEAGAVVVLQEPWQNSDKALQQAVEVARQFSKNIEIVQ